LEVLGGKAKRGLLNILEMLRGKAKRGLSLRLHPRVQGWEDVESVLAQRWLCQRM
jgi:hypothetical protein